MIKKRTLILLITLSSVIVSTALLLLPDPAAPIVALACPVLFIAVLNGICCGFFPALLAGTLPYFLAFVVSNFSVQGFDYTVWVPMAVFGASGVMAACVYAAIGSAVGASVSAVLTGRIVLGVSNLIIYHLQGRTYTIGMFLRDGFVSVWPGIAAVVVFLPLLIVWFRRRGIMKLLRGEKVVI